MEKILVAVGSIRRPKLNAVWEALSVVGPTLDPNVQFEVVGVEVPSGVRHTPLSREDMMTGARQRAEALVMLARAKGENWKFFVGLEGGLDVVLPGKLDAIHPAGTDTIEAGVATAAPGSAQHVQPKSLTALGAARNSRHVFLENWAYVADAEGRGAFGQSGAVLLPDALAARVVDDGVELAEAVDAFVGAHGIRDSQGAWGVLTRNMITRQDAFRTAVINAFAPFFNRAIYAKSMQSGAATR